MKLGFFEGFARKIGGPGPMDYYVFCIQCAAFLNAGLPLNNALEQIGPHQKNKYLRESLKNISMKMKAGMSAAKAFQQDGNFPAIFAPTIESGEKASELKEIFDKLGDQMWLKATLYSKIKSALLTPKIAGVLMSLLIIGFAKVMIPQYEKMYKESGLTMPWLTEMFAKVVNGFFNNFLLVVIVSFGLYRLAAWFFATHPEIVGKIKLKMPIYKPMHFSVINYQFTSNLALMLNSGLNIVPACMQTAKVVDNILLQQTIIQAAKSMMAGATLSEAFAKADKYKCIDPLVLGFIDSGEKAGSVVEMLEDAAEIHKTLLAALLDKVSTKLTILVITPMGLAIVGMYLMSLLPMISYFDKLIK